MKIINRLSSTIYYSTYGVHHTMVAGYTGSGKGFISERYLGKYCAIGYKCIDFHSLERFEGFFYGLDNDKDKLITKAKNLTNGVYSPHCYKNDIYMFCGNKLMQDKKTMLPRNVQIVSLNENDLDSDDLLLLLGKTDASKSVLLMVFDVYKKYFKKPNINLADVELACEWIIFKSCINSQAQTILDTANKTTVGVIKRNISATRESGLFNKSFPEINIEDILKDTESISTMSCALLDTWIQRAVALSIILKKIVRYKQIKTKYADTMIYVREMQTFFDKDNEMYEFCDLLRAYLKFILREGRDNRISLLCDFQSLGDIPTEVLNKFVKVIALRLTDSDAKKLLMYAYRVL